MPHIVETPSLQSLVLTLDPLPRSRRDDCHPSLAHLPPERVPPAMVQRALLLRRSGAPFLLCSHPFPSFPFPHSVAIRPISRTTPVSTGAASAKSDRDRVALGPLLADTHGLILDVGPGHGDQLHFFTPCANKVTRIFGLEPTLAMHPRLRARVRVEGLTDKYVILGASASLQSMLPALEKVGVEPGSLDRIVTIKCICSFLPREVPAILAGFRGLLKPGGDLVFLEHVANKRDLISQAYQWVVNLVRAHLLFSTVPLLGENSSIVSDEHMESLPACRCGKWTLRAGAVLSIWVQPNLRNVLFSTCISTRARSKRPVQPGHSLAGTRRSLAEPRRT